MKRGLLFFDLNREETGKRKKNIGDTEEDVKKALVSKRNSSFIIIHLS